VNGRIGSLGGACAQALEGQALSTLHTAPKTPRRLRGPGGHRSALHRCGPGRPRGKLGRAGGLTSPGPLRSPPEGPKPIVVRRPKPIVPARPGPVEVLP